MDALDPYLALFRRSGNTLLAAGRPVSEIAREYGTPLYLYDRAALRARRDAIKANLPSDLLITYAVKANPNRDILRFMGSAYDGIDVASQGEIETGLAAGVPAERMSFAGPGKSIEELRFAIRAGVGTISLESERELDHIETICSEAGKDTAVLIRVNPEFEFSRSGLKMGGGSKQFGVDSERVPALIERLSASPRVRYKGIHIFSGTQNLNADSVVEAFQKILEYAAALREGTGRPIEVLNLGGGFGIPYFKGDLPLDLSRVGAGVVELLDRFRAPLAGTRFKIELGRYLVGEAGLYISRVRYRKTSRGATFLILDGGMHQHLAASGNISQSPIRRNMIVLAADNLQGEPEKVNVVGPLCTPLDTFGLNIELPRVEEGGVVVIPNSGAYGPSMSPLAFLGHPAPKEILL